MSFRLFVYYCAAWGAATAYFGWILGRLIEGDSHLMGATLRGLSLGLFLALGLGLLDSLAAGSAPDAVTLGVRLGLAVMVGTAGGLIGGFVGQAFFMLSDSKWTFLLIFGWALTGTLIGAAPAAFDYVTAVLKAEERRGGWRKLRNGLMGGTIGGVLGGALSVLLNGAWASVFRNAETQNLWSPSTTGYITLGACIGLSVALAQVILREAWVRVEAGFRPGRQILLTKQETTIGRAESCDIGLFGDPTIEKVHAKIIREGYRWLLADAGTPGGTRLNGQLIAAPTPLTSGDRIQVGSSELSIGMRTREPAPAVPPAPIQATS